MSITTDRITKTPGICGGNACIQGSRITIWGLASYRRKGASDEQILGLVPGLTPADLEAAWEYVAANEEEIDRVIRQNEYVEVDLAE